MAVRDHIRLDDYRLADDPLDRKTAALDLRLDALDDYAPGAFAYLQASCPLASRPADRNPGTDRKADRSCSWVTICPARYQSCRTQQTECAACQRPSY